MLLAPGCRGWLRALVAWWGDGWERARVCERLGLAHAGYCPAGKPVSLVSLRHSYGLELEDGRCASRSPAESRTVLPR
jgi:hypothetical protein